MNICVLDGGEIKDRAALHEVLADTLGFPHWYGGNLDALYDCLTDIWEETEIRLVDIDRLEEHLGAEYAHSVLRVIREAAEENDYLSWDCEG